MPDTISLIAGLGNPGSSYEQTRHNAGFWFLDALAERYHADFHQESRFHGSTARATVDDCQVHLLKPATYMNRSGQSVATLSRYFKIPVTRILVVHDDLDLNAGIVRVKQGGGHGGHNGLRDIIAAFGGETEFYRLRIGIGHPGNSRDVVDYVLRKPEQQERSAIDEAIDAALASLPRLLDGDIASVQQQLHSRGDGESPSRQRTV